MGLTTGKMPSSNWPPIAAVAVTVCASVYWLFLSLQPAARSCVWVRDDAYYYFEVATRIAAGQGPTFDGINPTNGFHPLWMLLMVPVFAAAPSPASGLAAAMVLMTLINACTMVVAYRLASRLFSRPIGVATLLLFTLPQLNYLARTGMESGLLVLLIGLAVMWDAERQVLTRGTGRPAAFLFGGLLGLVFLARVDAGGFAVAAVILGAYFQLARGCRQRSAGQRLADAAALAAPVLLLAGLYCAWNLRSFGHALPVSASLKTSFPNVMLRTGSLRESAQALVGLGASLALVILVASQLRRLPSGGCPDAGPGRFPAIVLALSLGCVLHALAVLLTMGHGAGAWYYASYVFVFLLLSAWGMSVIGRVLSRWRLPRVAPALGIALLALLSVGLNAGETRLWGRLDYGFPRQGYYAAQWVNANLPDDTVLGMTDAGAFGFFCQPPVVNLDGVINSYEYASYLRAGRLHEFLAREDIRYIAQHSVAAALSDESYRGAISADQAGVLSPHLVRGNEVYRSAPYYDGAARTLFIIWEIPPEALSAWGKR